jgi:hypothetical protein
LGASARSGVVALIDLGEQDVHFFVDGTSKHSWSIVSGRGGYQTPTGRFRPQRLEEE